MYVHNFMLVLPEVALAYGIVGCLCSVHLANLRMHKKYHAINCFKAAMVVIMLVSGIIVGVTYRPRFMYLSKLSVGFALIADVFILYMLVGAFKIIILPGLKEKQKELSARWTVLFIGWFMAFLIMAAHLFLSSAAVLGLDFVFRPIVGQDFLEDIAIMREDDSMNRADREEQDYWNSVANTIQD